VLIGFRNAALWSFLSLRSALNSTFFILKHLRDLLSGVINLQHNESKMKFVANYSNNRFLSIRCCSPSCECMANLVATKHKAVSPHLRFIFHVCSPEVCSPEELNGWA